jgi:hypothetical protein
MFLSLCEGLRLLFLACISSVLYQFNPMYRRFGRTCCLYLHLYSEPVVSMFHRNLGKFLKATRHHLQKYIIFIGTALRTLNLTFSSLLFMLFRHVVCSELGILLLESYMSVL